MNIPTKDYKKLKNDIPFLLYLKNVGYTNKLIDVIFNHENLLINIAEIYYKYYIEDEDKKNVEKIV
jgi:hypothetical protein